MEFNQPIEYNKKFFYKIHAENEAERLVPDLVIWGKTKWFTA